MTDPEGRVTTYTYDLKNQLIQTEDDASRKYQYTYDGAGNLLSETDPLGNRTAYTYDGEGNLTETTDAAGNQEFLIYDAFQTFRVGRKTVALVRSDALHVGRSNTGDYKSFVDINATTDFVHDF